MLFGNCPLGAYAGESRDYIADLLSPFLAGGGRCPTAQPSRLASHIMVDFLEGGWVGERWEVPWREGRSQLRHRLFHAHVFLLCRLPSGPGTVGTLVS